MKNKYTFGKYFKEHFPKIATFLTGLIICILTVFSIIHITTEIKFNVYILVFGLFTFAIIFAIYFNYQDCKKEYYQEQNINNKNH